ncbi:alanine dehydrogenase [Dielma fastidiosa]|uniref:Alanine dehydrogenase n=1 Tax=Dielma fastidiosa TaxID=1034346 RepID=A0AB35UPB9_9FIRM|nr:alanine dehydrogenase [Dielma fastidiosa]MDY5168464.1 alanine dehydrogenase [Dielma fastidiosa]
MIIGIPKEIKNNENRVSCTPAGVFALCKAGHKVIVEANAGIGSGFSNEEYQEAGAEIADVKEVFKRAELIVKVKEYLPSEYQYLREDQMVFTYLHIANDPEFAKALIDSKTTAIAYETVRDRKGGLPLLTPMSEVAGRMAVQVGATMLQKNNNGRGLLLGGVPGVFPAEVVIIGGGTVGLNAAKIACGLGAIVTVFDINAERMGYIDDISGGTIHTAYNNEYNLRRALKTADLVIGAVLVPGAKAPKIVTKDMVQTMKPGSAIVDVAIDQGGCIETSDHITTHDHPTFERYGVLHYSVANMPGAVPRTSTMALSNATLPYLMKLADHGTAALKADPGFLLGLNTYQGHITYRGVSEALGMAYTDPETLL